MYENETYEEILQRMLERVSNKLDKREGSVIWDTHSPTAIELQILYIELDNILKESYGDTASREYLVRRAKERGLFPYSATHAILKGEFLPTNVDVLGKRFSLNDLNYIVKEKIADGSYRVECETAGELGNRYFGALIPIEYINGLEKAELTELLIPGEDEEDTEVFRERYFASFSEEAFGGNRKDYQEKVNAIQGVGGVKVIRVWNGDIHPSQMIPDDDVQEWYEQTISELSGTPAEWLQTVYTAASEKKLTVGGTVKLVIISSTYDTPGKALVETVQTAIDPEVNAGEGDGLAPIGHVVNVSGVESVEISLTTELTYNDGYGWSNLQESITEAVEAYLLELRKEWETSSYLVVRISQIEARILDITGIVDITGTALNGKQENLTLGPYEIPVFGGINT